MAQDTTIDMYALLGNKLFHLLAASAAMGGKHSDVGKAMLKLIIRGEDLTDHIKAELLMQGIGDSDVVEFTDIINSYLDNDNFVTNLLWEGFILRTIKDKYKKTTS